MQRQSFTTITFDLSPEIHTLAKQAELGELYKVYPVSKRFTTIWGIGQTCLVFSILAFTGCAILILYTSIPHAPALPLAIPILAAASALLLLIAGCYMSYSPKIYAHWQVYLWQDGFIYEKKQVRHAFRWNQIESVQTSASHAPKSIQTKAKHTPNRPLSSFYTCKVRHKDGYEVSLGSLFSDASELIDVILEESAYHLAPQDLRITPSRHISTFTDLKLDREGIGNAQETLPWSEVQELITKNGEVTLHKKEE